MAESSVDRVSISKEARVGGLPAVAPGWIPPVLKRFYDFTRKWAKKFSGELKEDREEELIRVVSKSFRGEI